MFSMKCLQTAAVTFAALGFGLAGTSASAGHDDARRSCDRGSYDRGSYDRGSYDRGSYGHGSYDRGYDRGYHSGSSSHVSASYRGDNYRVSVSFGSSRSYDRSCTTSSRVYVQERVYREPCTTTVVRYSPPPSGYWTEVYRPPVYETRYDRCGYPIRVCVREGYYERVWVSTGSCR